MESRKKSNHPTNSHSYPLLTTLTHYGIDGLFCQYQQIQESNEIHVLKQGVSEKRYGFEWLEEELETHLSNVNRILGWQTRISFK